MPYLRQGGCWKWCIAAALVLPAGAWLTRERGADAQVKREDLRPGLAATYRDGTVEIVQLEPTVALALKASEAPHPRLSGKEGTARWEGYLNVLRAGDYQFSATLRGKVRLTVAGKDVLTGEVNAEAPARKEGPVTRLEAGVHPLTAAFTRLPGAARLELFWKSPFFHVEPLPHTVVKHLPAKLPARLATDHAIERGRFLAEEMSCISCHKPAAGDRLARGLQALQGPELSKVGGRVSQGWLRHWLTAGHDEFPGRVMPKTFSDDPAGRTEVYAVTAFLTSLGGPLKPAVKQPAKQLAASEERGRRLFTTTGCIVCHRSEEAKLRQGRAEEPGPAKTAPLLPLATKDGSPRNVPLTWTLAKTTPEQLAAYLADPLAVDPSGRMPHMLLDKKEATDLANYLCSGKAGFANPEEPTAERKLAAFQRYEPDVNELERFKRLSQPQQWVELGRRVVIGKSCASCHTIAPAGKPLPAAAVKISLDDIKNPAKHDRGCLASGPEKRGKAPHFPLTDDVRGPLRAFLKEGTRGAGSPSPVHAARVALERFNCLACHSRDGQGGLTTDLIEQMRRFEKAENAEAIVPPTLTGVGHKLRTPWLRQVLTEKGRARPWMALRMPQFGSANVGHLPEALAALEGAEPDDAVHKVALTNQKIESGRQLAGKSAFGCVSCHDLAGIPNAGTRGPDLAFMNQRVRYHWYRRWLESAQRMEPGTKMPTVFPDGQSLMDNILGGKADAQAEAMWAYFSLGPTLPLPEGMEPPKGLVVQVKDRPVVLRTFMPEAGSRAVAVGYPSSVSLAFDAATCRLAYAWSGHFLDASPVWNDRGGSPAKVLGTRFWTAPAGCPWGVTEKDEPPDFAAQARDPAFGALMPEGKLFTGTRRLSFDGYTLDKEGAPVFRYRLDAGNGAALKVEERPAPLRGAGGVGVLRRFTVETPARRNVWLLAGESGQAPRRLDGKGQVVSPVFKDGRAEISARGSAVVLPQGGKAVVLVPAEVPRGAVWHLRQQGKTWQALLRLPDGPTGRAAVRLEVWSAARDDPAALRELTEQRP